ncbi:MAG: hypothetical protein KDJ47_14130 [Hyphomicrobiaceae bacterium]|nr:hypothetical protein [Hyphomicrobiaceae bacterium]
MPFASSFAARRHAIAFLAVAGTLGLDAAGVAMAQTAGCTASAVSARGEPSRFEWVAKTKARANWRRRVRALPGLGPSYADWKKAADLEESCISGPAGTVCSISGVPCR